MAVHTKVEEEVFYPAIKAKIDQDEIDEALVEHQAADALALEIQEMDGSEDLYDAKVHVLGEQVRHHVEEEEEEMFEEAKKAGLDLDALGERMAARQDELLNEVADKGDIEGE